MPRLDILSELGDNLIVSPTPLTFINPSLPSLVCVTLASEVSSPCEHPACPRVLSKSREMLRSLYGLCSRDTTSCFIY